MGLPAAQRGEGDSSADRRDGISNEVTLRARPKAANLSRKIEEALTRQALREAKHIQVDVDGTTVKLGGTVRSWQERDAAQGAAWSAPGVHAVLL